MQLSTDLLQTIGKTTKRYALDNRDACIDALLTRTDCVIGSWHCPKCLSPPAVSSVSISNPRSAGRPPKSHPRLSKPGKVQPANTPNASSSRRRPKQSLAGDDALFTSHRIKVKVPNPNSQYRDSEEGRATPMIVRLKVPKRPVEEEPEEKKVPYGGS